MNAPAITDAGRLELRRAAELRRADAPLPAAAAALELARSEYATRPSTFGGYMLLSRGSDGGMHYRGDAATAAAARAWVDVRVRDLAGQIASGELLGSVLFWDGARGRWYLG